MVGTDNLKFIVLVNDKIDSEKCILDIDKRQ